MPIKKNAAISEGSRAAYKRSWRAKRRQTFAEVRATVRSAKPPPLLGPYTDILTVLVASGPVRWIALQEMFGEPRVASIEKYIKPGLCVGWRLRGSDKRGARGRAIALNPGFPLYKEVRAVLRALKPDFPFDAKSDLTKADRAAMPCKGPRCRPERMHGSANRLCILVALVVLGGRCKISALASSVPGMRRTMVFLGVRSLVNHGIAAKDGSVVHLVRARWTTPFRKLLLAYVRLKPGLAEQIRACSTQAVTTARHRRGHTFFGTVVTQRALMLLATEGPMPWARLEIRSGLRGEPARLGKLCAEGILVRTLVASPKANYYVIGLNAAHPIYPELRALLCSLVGAPPSRKVQLFEKSQEYSLRSLFPPGVVASILISLETAKYGKIDAASIARIHPEHDIGLLMRRLRELSNRGVVMRNAYGTVILCQFNPDYPHHDALRALLRRIVRISPHYKTLGNLEDSLYTSTVQRTAHRRSTETR